jgi:putative membrane protein
MPCVAGFQAPSRISLLLALLTASGVASSLVGVSRVAPRAHRHRCNIRSNLNDPTTPVPLFTLIDRNDPATPVPERVLHVQRQLEAVHKARRTEYISEMLMAKIGRTNFNSPTYKKLFTHETWANYTGRAPEARWRGMLFGWKGSSIARAVLPRVLAVTGWSAVIATIGRRLPMSPVGLLPMGTAIGLLLVFRNDQAYQRLAEARALYGKIILLGREIAAGAVTYLPRAADGYPPEAAYTIVRLMAVFGWTFKARLRDGEKADEVIQAVLPAEEAAWLLRQRSPVVAIIGCVRQLLHQQQTQARQPLSMLHPLGMRHPLRMLRATPRSMLPRLITQGHLDKHLQYKLERDLLELYQVVGGCERLFTSPIPPTFTRHVVRSMALWLLALPLALIGSMPTLAVVCFSTATAYIFLGIEELGVQAGDTPLCTPPHTHLLGHITLTTPFAGLFAHPFTPLTPLTSPYFPLLPLTPACRLYTPSRPLAPLTSLPLGAQVEQPFDILPLWQICHLATRNVEEVAFTLNDATLELEPFTLTPPIWDRAAAVNLADRLLVGPYWHGPDGPGDED